MSSGQLINSVQRKKHFSRELSLNEKKRGNRNGYLAGAEKAGDDGCRYAIVGRNDGGNVGILGLRRCSGGGGNEEAARGSERKC